ncbi:MAG: poly-beta-1,6-N-acetyl-D-glucosamine biosynthesis protein PgaD [Alphaproteobacteria bacterium]
MTLSSDIIIFASSTKSFWVRARDVILCMGLWYVYYILMQDFFEFVSTIMAWKVFGAERPGLEAALAILETMKNYALIIVSLGCLLISWAIYNQARFRGNDRRRAAPVVTAEDMARFYNVSQDDITRWRSARILVMHHDKRGMLTGVDTKIAPIGSNRLRETVAA